MSNWPLFGGSRLAMGGSLSGYGGVVLSEPSAAHTPTAWEEVVAATPSNAAGILVNCWSGYNGGKRGLLNLALGAAGSERPLISGLALDPGSSIPEVSGLSSPLYLPLSIPRGERISACWQVSSNGGSGLTRPDVMVHLVTPHPLGVTGGTHAETLGLDSATTSGTLLTTGTAFGAWVQLGVLTRRAFAFIPCVLGGTTGSTRHRMLVEFGIGTAGSQKAFVQQSLFQDTANQVSVTCLGHVFKDAAAGTAVWARVAASVSTKTLQAHIIALS